MTHWLVFLSSAAFGYCVVEYVQTLRRKRMRLYLKRRIDVKIFVPFSVLQKMDDEVMK